MKPISKYIFEQKTNSSYLLKQKFGEDLKEFTLNVYKIGEDKGREYISYKSPEVTSSAFGRYEKVFNIQNKKGNAKGMFTGINFTALNPRISYGDSRSIKLNHAVIVKFSEDWKTLTILFYADLGYMAKQVFEKFLNGELSEVCENETLQLLPKESAPYNERN